MSGNLILLLVVVLLLFYPLLWFIYQLRRYYRLRFRGFFVTREGRDNIIYEERQAGQVQRLTIYGELMSNDPHVVYVPNEEEWENKMPEWAHGRRAEILENIKRALGTKNYEYDVSSE